MADYGLRAPDQSTMFKAFGLVNVIDEFGTVQTQGDIGTTGWALDDIGPMYSSTIDEGGKPVEVMLVGYHINLRWNGDAATPPIPSDIEVVWSSNDPKRPRPLWWTRVFA